MRGEAKVRRCRHHDVSDHTGFDAAHPVDQHDPWHRRATQKYSARLPQRGVVLARSFSAKRKIRFRG
jgi:hypothetical protein